VAAAVDARKQTLMNLAVFAVIGLLTETVSLGHFCVLVAIAVRALNGQLQAFTLRRDWRSLFDLDKILQYSDTCSAEQASLQAHRSRRKS
jgi:hypothetical protein